MKNLQIQFLRYLLNKCYLQNFISFSVHYNWLSELKSKKKIHFWSTQNDELMNYKYDFDFWYTSGVDILRKYRYQSLLK